MQNIIRLITVSLLVFILGIFYLSLNRSSNYDTKSLVGNQLANIELKSLRSDRLFINDDFKKILIQKIPSGTLGKPDDVANCVAFLASNLSNYITGETLHVNGGMYMA